jgi:hypothetical protein
MSANSEVNVEAAALACLSAVVEQLNDEGSSRAGQYEGLFSYAVLDRLKANAQAFGVPLAEIGLAGFNPDTLLQVPRRVA